VPMYRLEILTPAQRELEEIALVHFEIVGPASARNITDKIYASLERLMTFPLSGPLLWDRWLRETGYRYVLSGKYICVYRLIGNVVFVYHIVFEATDYPQLIKDMQDIPKDHKVL
jgi:toxin ParE1/3/4